MITAHEILLFRNELVFYTWLKKKSSSLSALSIESLPWTAFLTPSYPYKALILLGDDDLAC